MDSPDANVGNYAPTSQPGVWHLVSEFYDPNAGLAVLQFDDVQAYPAGGPPGGGGGGGGQQKLSDQKPDSTRTPCMDTVVVTATTTPSASSGFLRVIRGGVGTVRIAAIKKPSVPANRANCNSDAEVKDAEACSAIRRVSPIVRPGSTFQVQFSNGSQTYIVTTATGSYCAAPVGSCN